MSNITPSWFEDFKTRIVGSISSAENAIHAAAAAYMEAITKDPSFKDWIAEEVPQVSGGTWRTLEMVGRGQLDARIAAGGCPYGNKLRRLPMSEQKHALDGTIPLLTAGGDTLQVRLDALMPKQADQVFAPGHIRSLAEQKAWLEDRARETMAAKTARNVQPVEIDKKRRRIVVGGVTLTAADLADYLRKISE